METKKASNVTGLRLGLVLLILSVVFSRLFQLVLYACGVGCAVYLLLLYLANYYRSTGYINRSFKLKSERYPETLPHDSNTEELVEAKLQQARLKWLQASPSLVAAAIERLLNFIVRDFLWSWYEEVSGGRVRFALQVRALLFEALTNCTKRIACHDWTQLSIDLWIPIVMSHIKESRLAQERAKRFLQHMPAPLLPTKHEQNWRIAAFYRKSDGLHSVLLNCAKRLGSRAPTETELDEAVVNHIRKRLETLVFPEILPAKDMQSDLFRLLAREIVSNATFGAAAAAIATSEFWNELIEALATSVIHERDLVQKLREKGVFHAPGEMGHHLETLGAKNQLSSREILAFDEDIYRAIKTSSLWELLQLRDTLSTQIDQLASDISRYKGASIHATLVHEAARILKRMVTIQNRVVRRINELSGPHKDVIVTMLPSLGMVLSSDTYLPYFVDFMTKAQREPLVQFWLDIDALRREYRLFDSNKKVNLPAIAEPIQTTVLFDTLSFIANKFFAPSSASNVTNFLGHSLVNSMQAVCAFCRESLESVQEMDADKAGDYLSSLPFPSLGIFLSAQERVFRTMLDSDFEPFIKSPSFAQCAFNIMENKLMLQSNDPILDLDKQKDETPSGRPQKDAVATRQPSLEEVLRQKGPFPHVKKHSLALSDSKPLPYSPLGTLFSEFFPSRAAGKRSTAESKVPELKMKSLTIDNFERELDVILNSTENAYSFKSSRSIHSQVSRAKKIRSSSGGKPSVRAKRAMSKVSQSSRQTHSTTSSKQRKRRTSASSIAISLQSAQTLADKEETSVSETSVAGQSISMSPVSAGAENNVFAHLSTEAIAQIPSQVQTVELELVELNKRLRALEKRLRKMSANNGTGWTKSAPYDELAHEIDSLRSRRLSIYEAWHNLTMVSAPCVLSFNRFNACVTDSYEKHENGEEFIAYVVEIRPLGSFSTSASGTTSPAPGDSAVKLCEWKWLVWRRYSDFFALFQTFKAKFGARFLEKNKIFLPSKQLPGFQHLKPGFIDKRRQGLDKFLQQILGNSVLAGSLAFRLFLVQSFYFETGGLPGDVYSPTSVKFPGSGGASFPDKPVARFPPTCNLQTEAPNLTLSQSSSESSVHSGVENDIQFVESLTNAGSSTRAATEVAVDILIEIFDWKRDYNGSKKKATTKGYWSWFRRQVVLTLLKQFMGGMIERRIRETIEFFLSDSQLAHYISLLSEQFWPTSEGGKFTARQLKKTPKEEAAQFLIANEKLQTALIVWLGPIIGKSHARRGADTIIQAFQHPVLNRHLLLTLFDEFTNILFSKK